MAVGRSWGLVLRRRAPASRQLYLRQRQPDSVLADGRRRGLGRYRLVGPAFSGVADSGNRVLRAVAALGIFPPRHLYLPFHAGGAAWLHGHCDRADRRMDAGRNLSHRRGWLHPRSRRDLRLVLSHLHGNSAQPGTGRSTDVAGKLAVVLGPHQTRFRMRGLAISSRPTATRKSPMKRMAMTIIGGTHHHHQPLMIAAL